MTVRFDDPLRPRVGDDGVVVDRYGRTSDECATAAAMAADAAEDIRTTVALISEGAIVLGRLGGARQVQRLAMSAELFQLIAERDRGFAADLREIADRTRGVRAVRANAVVEPRVATDADSLSADGDARGEIP